MPQSPRRSRERKPNQAYNFPEGFVAEGKLEFKPPETAPERNYRLRKDFWSFFIKEALVYIVALLILSMTTVYCLWTLWRSDAPLEERKWVMSTLTSLLVGIVGYVFGKSTK